MGRRGCEVAMRTLPEILTQLKQLDEIELVELLGVNSENLVDRFADLVEANSEKFNIALNQWFDDAEDIDDDNFSNWFWMGF